MKTILLISILGMTTFGMHAAGGGAGGSGGGSAGGGGSTGSAGHAGSASRGSPLSPVMSRRSTTQPTTGRGQTTTATPNQPTTANSFAGHGGLTPTGTASHTSRFQNNFRLRDHTVTAGDQALLTTLQGMIHTQLGIPLADGSPVHLFIDNGAVTLVGFVTTADEQKRILSQVQQTSGVGQMVNRLHVGMPSTEMNPRTVQENADPAQVNPLTPAFSAGQVDRAFSMADQRLLQQIRLTAAVQLGMNPNVPRNTLVAPQLPVHFVVQNGVVTVTGQVITTTQGTALVATIGQTPGVVQVVDNLTVGGVNAVPQSGMTEPSIQ